MATPADPRGISVTTPLGPDALFLTSFRGREGLSQLFHFQLELMAENRTTVAFDKLIGQKITFSILLPDGKTKRFWNGICNSLAQTGRDSTFTSYRMEVVPQFWLLTRRTQCRIFQHITIPDILKKVLTGLDVKLELQGTFEKRDYCVQYRESDFAFASRLMEEEGIYYFFKHTDGGHQMVIGNSPQSHPAVAFAEKAIYEELEGGNRPDMRVHRWEKTQELRSGKVTLWDHCFELPGQHLDAERPTQESVAIGKVTHKLKLPANDALELYDYPGAYAQRVDGIDAGGGDQAGDLQKIFQDNKRTALIRMEQEAVQAITIRGSGNCRQFASGNKFTLERHFDADGAYVLTTVEHSATASANARSGSGGDIDYQNHFTCIPLSLPFRPPLTTPEPIIPGPQTATVVGPPGEIISCDKYGRVKVQFHWDRLGKMDADSSCWIRVSNNWGGANWGGMFIPHVKQEVIVEFEEGDPDRPVITGRVYNAECMPPLELPANKTKSALRDHGGSEIVMEGDKGKEQIKMFCPHGNTTISMGAPASPPGIKAWTDNDWTAFAGGDYNWKVVGNSTTQVYGFYIQHVLGSCDTIVGGVKTDITVGQHFDINLVTKLSVMLGWKKDIDPVGNKRAKAVEQEAIAKVEQKFATQNAKIASLSKRIAKRRDEIGKLAVHVKSTMDHHVGELNEKIDGAVTQTMAEINQKVRGNRVVNAATHSVYGKSNITLESKGGMRLEAAGNMVIKFGGLKMNGGFCDIKDGTLKIV